MFVLTRVQSLDCATIAFREQYVLL